MQTGNKIKQIFVKHAKILYKWRRGWDGVDKR